MNETTDTAGTSAAEGTVEEYALRPETVMAAGNIEQRRAGIEMLGWDRILAQLNAKVIDADADPQVGTLVEVDLPGLDGSGAIRVKIARRLGGKRPNPFKALVQASRERIALSGLAVAPGGDGAKESVS